MQVTTIGMAGHSGQADLEMTPHTRAPQNGELPHAAQKRPQFAPVFNRFGSVSAVLQRVPFAPRGAVWSRTRALVGWPGRA
jgi:hypothetical protein